MPTTMPSRTVSTVSTVRTRRYGGSTLRYGLYGTKYLLATMPTTVPTTMPTTRTVSTVSTVRTLRYGGSTLQYGLYGTKYLLATMPTTVPTTMPGPTRTVSTVSTVRTLRYGGSTLQYGLYGAKYLLLLYGTVSSGPITCYPITMLPGTSWYEALQALQVLTHRFAVESRSRPQSACVAAQGHHRPRGSFSAVCAA